MRIHIKAFATLARYAPPDADSYELEDGATVRDVIERLGVPDDELNLVFVNSLHAPRDAALHDGDAVGLFPAVGGG